jgi:hypothetical protein
MPERLNSLFFWVPSTLLGRSSVGARVRLRSDHRSCWRALRRHSRKAATGRGGKPHRPGTRPPLLLVSADSTPLDEVREGGVPVRRADQGHVGASGARQRRPATHVS